MNEKENEKSSPQVEKVLSGKVLTIAALIGIVVCGCIIGGSLYGVGVFKG